MADQRKPILCVDFDGVIHDYMDGWRDGKIYGEVTEGFFAWLDSAAKVFQVVVYSSRSRTPEGVRAMMDWLIPRFSSWSGLNDHEDAGVALGGMLRFAHEKPPAFLTIDDRAIRFNGSWDEPFMDPSRLRRLRPWNEMKAGGRTWPRHLENREPAAGSLVFYANAVRGGVEFVPAIVSAARKTATGGVALDLHLFPPGAQSSHVSGVGEAADPVTPAARSWVRFVPDRPA